MTERTFTRGQLRAMTGVPDESLSFWLKQGLLGASKGLGTGKVRRFEPVQVYIAAVLWAARRAHVSIEMLRFIDRCLQEGARLWFELGMNVKLYFDWKNLESDLAHLRWLKEYRPSDDDDMQDVLAYFDMKARFDKLWEGGNPHSIESQRVSATLRDGEAELLEIAYPLFIRDKGMSFLGITLDDGKSPRVLLSPDTEMGLPADCVLCIAVDRIFDAIDWPDGIDHRHGAERA
jgi:hypothetical protein